MQVFLLQWERVCYFIIIAILPPTKKAALQHFKRVYLQVQQWLGEKLSPNEWGWKQKVFFTL